MDVNVNNAHLGLSWNNLPSEIYLLLFKYLPPSALVVCMFVSQTWRVHAERVIEIKRKWEKVFNITEFKFKCKSPFSGRNMLYNYVLWHSIQKATVTLHNLLEIEGIKKISIYRNNLIVVAKEHVQHYEPNNLNNLSTLKWTSCEDYQENDTMAIKVFKQGEYFTLELLHKMEPKPIYMTKSEPFRVTDIICYKIHKNECHVLTYQNCHHMYTVETSGMNREFLARYYGNPDDSCAIQVYDSKRCYLILKSGSVLGVDSKYGNFVKMTRIASKSQGRTTMLNHKRFLWFSIDNDEACAQTEPTGRRLSIERYAPWADPSNNIDPYIGIVRNVSCMLVHSDILFIGHWDGTVELISMRDLSQAVLNTEPLRRFNVRDFKKDIPDAAVLAIDIYEEEGCQHMYIATSTHVLHIHVTHPHSPTYMWGDEAYKSIMMAE